MGSVISVRVNKLEQEILNKASNIYGCGISSLMKKIVFERLEEDYDIKKIQDYEKKKSNGTLKTSPISKLYRELGI